MLRARSAAEQEHPTPEPGSAVVRTGTEDGSNVLVAIDEGRRLYGSETSDAWFAALADGSHPLCRMGAPDSRRRPIGEEDLVTHPDMLEAAERYAGDTTHLREIEDVQASRHPLQRQRPGGL
jgi:hypothetical protein